MSGPPKKILSIVIIPFKAAQRGPSMTDINELTAEQIQELPELSRRLKEREERAERNDRPELPNEILEELDTFANSELKNKLKKLAKGTIKYEGGRWTKSGAINKLFAPEFRKYQVEATQTVAAYHKGADRLRTTARAATEIFNDLQYVIEEGGEEKDMRNILEKARRLTIYAYATGKVLDGDARDLTTKAIRLPGSLKYLEDAEDGDKDLVFPPDIVKKT